MVWLLIFTLWTAMLLSPIILLFVFLPSGRRCPRCSADETLLMRSGWPLRVFTKVIGRRWCPKCGWEGLARHKVTIRPLPKFEVVPPDEEEEEGEGGTEEPWKA